MFFRRRKKKGTGNALKTQLTILGLWELRNRLSGNRRNKRKRR